MDQRAIHFFVNDTTSACKRLQNQLQRDEQEQQQIEGSIEIARQQAVDGKDLRQAYMLRRRLQAQQRERSGDLFCMIAYREWVSLFENLRLAADYAATEYSKRYKCPVILCDYMESCQEEVFICCAVGGRLLFSCALNAVERKKCFLSDDVGASRSDIAYLTAVFKKIVDMWEDTPGPATLLNTLHAELGIVVNGPEVKRFILENCERQNNYVFVARSIRGRG